MTPNDNIQLNKFTTNINSLNTEQLDGFAKSLQWGTFGPAGTEPMKQKTLIDLSTDHLENILVTQSHISAVYRKVILHIIKSRL
jgi:hypothetical protein